MVQDSGTPGAETLSSVSFSHAYQAHPAHHVHHTCKGQGRDYSGEHVGSEVFSKQAQVRDGRLQGEGAAHLHGCSHGQGGVYGAQTLIARDFVVEVHLGQPERPEEQGGVAREPRCSQLARDQHRGSSGAQRTAVQLLQRGGGAAESPLQSRDMDHGDQVNKRESSPCLDTTTLEQQLELLRACAELERGEELGPDLDLNLTGEQGFHCPPRCPAKKHDPPQEKERNRQVFHVRARHATKTSLRVEHDCPFGPGQTKLNKKESDSEPHGS